MVHQYSSSSVGVILYFWVTLSGPFSILLFKIHVPFYPPHTIPVFVQTLSMDRLPTYSWVATEKPSIMIFLLEIFLCSMETADILLYRNLWRPSSPVKICKDGFIEDYLSLGGLFFVKIFVKKVKEILFYKSDSVISSHAQRNLSSTLCCLS